MRAVHARIRRHIARVGFVVGFAVVGTAIIISSKAAPSSIDTEAENGSSLGASVYTDENASGKSAVRFGSVELATPAKPLAFDLASTETLRSSPKLVFAHYFTPYPISIDNAADPNNDYYVRHYLNPYGEAKTDPATGTTTYPHLAYGGLLRQRPLPRAKVSASDWKLEDMKTEVRNAIAAGIDGFMVDLLTMQPGNDCTGSDAWTTARNWCYVKKLLVAAHEVDPGFKIILEPDASSSGTMSDINKLIQGTLELAAYPAVYRLPDGRLPIVVFHPEHSTRLAGLADYYRTAAESAAWWQRFVDGVQASGVSVAFIPCFLSATDELVNNFKAMSYGISAWGSRSPTSNPVSSGIATITKIHGLTNSRGDKLAWVQPVSVQDERPRSKVYFEANNTEQLRTTWQIAIDGGADWVQIPTWNDYSENTQIAPSTHQGWNILDINAYYLSRFKTGSEPIIRRDVAYVSNRSQLSLPAIRFRGTGSTCADPALPSPMPVHITGTLPETAYMQLHCSSAPSRDNVEVLSFLAAPARISLTIGSESYNYDAPAGASTALYPLRSGAVSVRIERHGITTGEATSPITVTDTPYVQDMHYDFIGTARD